MAIDIEVYKRNEYIEVVVTGFFDLNDATEKFLYVLDYCRMAGIHKALINYQALQGHIGGTDKGFYAFKIENLYEKHLEAGGPQLQLAYVAPELSAYEPHAVIWEKSGSKFKLFDEIDAALKWLEVKDP